jgi:hypothetical protein
LNHRKRKHDLLTKYHHGNFARHAVRKHGKQWSDRVFIGGLRVYSPQAMPGYGRAEPRKQDPLSLIHGDYEAGCLAKNRMA